MEQSDIGARQNRQMQIGQIAGVGAPWVDDDDFHLRTARFSLFEPTKKYRMGVGHVTADDHHAITELQIFIAAWRCIGAETTFVADHGRRHAQA